MNLQKFTLKAQEALQTAQEIANGYSNQSIEPIHLLAALLQDSAGIVPPILMKIGANLNYLKLAVASVRKNSYFKNSPFIIHAENCKDGTNEWLKNNKYNIEY